MIVNKRKRLMKRFSLVPIGMLAFGMIGPFLFSLFKQFSNEEFVLEVCVATPDPHLYSLVILSAFFVWFIAFLPIYSRQVINAIYVRFVLWFGGVSVLLIFNLMALFGIQCWALTSVSKFLFYAVPLSFFGGLIFVWLLRNSLKRGIDINRHAFNFENMQWEITAQMVHVDERVNSSKILMWTVAAGFLGMLLSDLPIASWFGFSEVVNNWALVIFLWLVGWISAFGYGGGDLYVLWLVWKRSRVEGRAMVTAELVEG